MKVKYINEDERYGDPVPVTPQDYIDLDAVGVITYDSDGIYEDGKRVASRV